MKNGFALLEILLAVSMFAVVALLFLSTLILGQEGSLISGERERAILIASEGIEAVRNIRDSSFGAVPAAGVYGVYSSSTLGWYLASTPDTTGPYLRTVTITDISSTVKDVEVRVDWQHTFGRTGTVVLTTRLTDWRRAVNQGVFRVTEYYLDTSDFTGTSYILNLDQDLEQDYFVIVQGSDGDGSANGNRGPHQDYAALVADPYGTGDLAITATTTQLRFARGAAANAWVGVITVVECLEDCAQAGFQLHDVSLTPHTGALTTGIDIANTPWASPSQVVLFGGFNGSGCYTTESNQGRHHVCHARLFPTGVNTINWTRDSSGGGLSDATSTVMVVEWGSEWTVQHVNVTGNNGGDGANAASEYNTASIASVNRPETWVWGTGHTNDNGIGDAAEGVLLTLGTGVSTSSNETSVAAGIEYANSAIDFDIYTMSHPDLLTDYVFKIDGDSGVVTYDATTSVESSAASMAFITNGSNGTGTSFPRSLWSARYVANDTIRAERRRSGQDWPAWIQGIDFSTIEPGDPDVTPPDTVTDLSVTDETDTVVSLTWTAPGDDGAVGNAASYDIRYSTTPITVATWGIATQVVGEPAPSSAGSTETFDVTGLTASTTYYFALQTSDEVPNVSDISNNASTTTDAPILTEADYLVVDSSGASVGGAGNRNVLGITLENTGGSSIVVDQMVISWSGVPGNRRLNTITIATIPVWSGVGSSPTTADILDVTILGSTTIDLTSLAFSNNIGGITLNIDFVMSDGSIRTITGITP